MKKFAVVGILFAALAGSAFAGGAGWLTDYNKALALSKKIGKPILADFTGSDWCGWCIKLKKEVFDKPEFKAWADKNVVLLELDFPSPGGPKDKKMTAAEKKQNAQLQDKFRIQGYPTIVFIDANGKKLGDYGYDEGGPKVWTKNAEAIMKKKKK